MSDKKKNWTSRASAFVIININMEKIMLASHFKTEVKANLLDI